jgi:hypothetical protein
MQQLNIKLTPKEEQTWSLEINGEIYEPVDIEFAKQLVKRAMIELNKAAIRRAQ